MFFIALLLLSSFRFIPCYKFPEIGKPFPELVKFLELFAFDFDVYVEFAFDDTSLFESYSETLLRFVKQNLGLIAPHFDKDVLPLQSHSEYIFLIDSM